VVLFGGHELSAFGNALNNQITGNAARNFLTGGAGDDRIDGGEGADFMDGGAGNDTFVVDNVGDMIQEGFGGGTDHVLSSVSFQIANSELENLTLQGGESINGTGNFRNNQLIGNSAANTLDAKEGNDVLDGKGGNDVLQGGIGADWFVFSTALGSGNVDQILRFETTSDNFALDDSVFAGLATGALAADAFAIGAAAQDGSDRIVYNAQTGALMFDSDGVGGAEAIVFATLDANLALSAAHFTIY
jgi:serralysin